MNWRKVTGNRLTVGPYTADYQDGTDLFKMMTRIVTVIADTILEKRAHQIKNVASPLRVTWTQKSGQVAKRGSCS